MMLRSGRCCPAARTWEAAQWPGLLVWTCRRSCRRCASWTRLVAGCGAASAPRTQGRSNAQSGGPRRQHAAPSPPAAGRRRPTRASHARWCSAPGRSRATPRRCRRGLLPAPRWLQAAAARARPGAATGKQTGRGSGLGQSSHQATASPDSTESHARNRFCYLFAGPYSRMTRLLYDRSLASLIIYTL